MVAAGPLGLSLRGRTSPLAWTRRLRVLAAVWAVLEVVIVAVGVVSGLAAPLAVVAAVAVPLLVDLACLITSPLEYRLSAHFVDEAAARLRRVAPTVVGITGSYGKTSTKGHVAALVRPSRTVVATPASFNNRAGLARAVNEQLADGTEVFVAEMGTYGPGEIADLCRWCPPGIAVITAIGPVHLERFGSEDRVLEAKAEIIRTADVVVLPVDDPRLAALADRAQAQGKRVIRCSGADPSADVCVLRTGSGPRMSAFVHGTVLAEEVEIPVGVQPGNLACAIGVALALEHRPHVHRLPLGRAPAGRPPLAGRPFGNGGGDPRRHLQLEPGRLRCCLAGSGVRGRRRRLRPLLQDPIGRWSSPRAWSSSGRGSSTRIGRSVPPWPRRPPISWSWAGPTGGPCSPGPARSTVRRSGPKWSPTASRRSTGCANTSVQGDVVLYENDLPDHYP